MFLFLILLISKASYLAIPNLLINPFDEIESLTRKIAEVNAIPKFIKNVIHSGKKIADPVLR